MGRQAVGVRGIRLRDGDYVVGAGSSEGGSAVLTVTEKGYGKRTPVSEYPIHGRGGIGCGGGASAVMHEEGNSADRITAVTEEKKSGGGGIHTARQGKGNHKGSAFPEILRGSAARVKRRCAMRISRLRPLAGIWRLCRRGAGAKLLPGAGQSPAQGSGRQPRLHSLQICRQADLPMRGG